MEDPPQVNHYLRKFEDEVILLTGATGAIGACLLFKLAVRLPTKKVYALCRGSIGDAIRKLESVMPQIEDILDSGKVEFVTGDLTRPGLGSDSAVRERMRDQVTTVINTAANISLVETLENLIRDNCQTAMSLFHIASEFRHIRLFIHFSSVAATSFLPGGVIEERLYDSPGLTTDSADDLAGLPSADASSMEPDDRYPWPHGQAKHLADRLLLRRSSSVPILIIRPVAVGPAIAEPFPFYGPDKSLPIHTMLKRFWFRRVPVDLIANNCLLHLADRTTGVVHCTAPLYVTRKVTDIMSIVRKCATEAERAEVLPKRAPTGGFMWQNKYQVRSFQSLPTFHFVCAKSEYQKSITGPLALIPVGHDSDMYLERRVRKIHLAMLEGTI
ncbi:male sterility protein-domain-containing protein [Aspergillus californicus]